MKKIIIIGIRFFCNYRNGTCFVVPDKFLNGKEMYVEINPSGLVFTKGLVKYYMRRFIVLNNE